MSGRDPRGVDADSAAGVFQLAMDVMGAQVAGEAASVWKSTGSNGGPTWLRLMLRLLLGWRKRSRDLGVAYYRYSSALHTGRAPQDMAGTVEDSTVLSELREDFEAAVEAVQEPSEGFKSVVPKDVASRELQALQEALEASDGDPDGYDEGEPVDLDEIYKIEEVLEDIEDAAEEEIVTVMKALGPDLLAKKLATVPDDAPAGQYKAEALQLSDEVGMRISAAADRIARDAARSAMFNISKADKNCIGYVRLSRTGTPCGWCAMLISRGLWLYKSESSATIGKDGDQYHDNCKCYAQPVFSVGHYNSSPLFNLNREYGDQWPKVTRGLSGRQALAAWRRYIRLNKKYLNP